MVIITDQAKNAAANNFVVNPIRIRAHTGDPGSDGLLNRTDGVADINTEDFELIETGSTANENVVNLGYLNNLDAVQVTHLSVWNINDELYAVQPLKTPVIVAANSALTINSNTINFKFQEKS